MARPRQHAAPKRGRRRPWPPETPLDPHGAWTPPWLLVQVARSGFDVSDRQEWALRLRRRVPTRNSIHAPMQGPASWLQPYPLLDNLEACEAEPGGDGSTCYRPEPHGLGLAEANLGGRPRGPEPDPGYEHLAIALLNTAETGEETGQARCLNGRSTRREDKPDAPVPPAAEGARPCPVARRYSRVLGDPLHRHTLPAKGHSWLGGREHSEVEYGSVDA